MKFKRLIAIAAMLACTAITATGCGGKKNSAIKDRLYIVYYPGGYGEEFLETFVKEYISEAKGIPIEKVSSNVTEKILL